MYLNVHPSISNFPSAATITEADEYADVCVLAADELKLTLVSLRKDVPVRDGDITKTDPPITPFPSATPSSPLVPSA